MTFLKTDASVSLGPHVFQVPTVPQTTITLHRKAPCLKGYLHGFPREVTHKRLYCALHLLPPPASTSHRAKGTVSSQHQHCWSQREEDSALPTPALLVSTGRRLGTHNTSTAGSQREEDSAPTTPALLGLHGKKTQHPQHQHCWVSTGRGLGTPKQYSVMCKSASQNQLGGWFLHCTSCTISKPDYKPATCN